MTPQDETLGRALRIADDAWAEMRRMPFFGGKSHEPLLVLPQVSEAEAERRSALGRELLTRIDALDLSILPHDVATTVRVAERHARTWAREAEWWWLAFDPLRVGFFALFAPTAYGGGFLLNSLNAQFQLFRFTEAGDFDRYLGLVADYGRLVGQLRARTQGQAERGIRMPRAQLQQAVALMSALRAQAPAILRVDAARLPSSRPGGFEGELERRIAGQVQPEFDAFLEALGVSYAFAAPEAVGVGQYPGGRDLYAELVRMHTTLDLTPEQVHAEGLDRMDRIEAAMDGIAAQEGFTDRRAYDAALEADPRWRADSAETVAAIFQRYIDRIAPETPRYFAHLPSAGCSVAPLPPALSGSMTFGYYDAPKQPGDPGRYLFNADNLTRRGLANLGALTYHELIPGHHLHLAAQTESADLHPLRRMSFTNAFNEGWAEYAAGLAGEMGMYAEPAERYGRLMMDAFLTCRLVVDTGMNALGWSLKRSRDYLRAHGCMSESELCSETVRYSCDIPAQSLAYKLGDSFLTDLRESMRSRLGATFDIRDFHDAVLTPGALPLPLVQANVERRIAELTRDAVT